MTDVSRCLKLGTDVKINILESFCPVQFGKYLSNDNHMAVILRHQKVR